MINIPLITILSYFIYYQKKNKGNFGIISLLILSYLTVTLLSVILYYSKLLLPGFEISLISMLYFSALTLLVLIGFIPYKDHKIDTIKIDNILLLKYLEKFLLYSSIISILFFLPFVFKAFHGDINQNRLNLKDTGEALGNFGLINSCASLVANLFMVTQMFFFLNLIPTSGFIKKRKSIVMLLASMSYVLYVLAYVGRDGVVFWLMSFIFQYLFFKKFIDSNIQKAIRKYFIVFSVLMLIPFAAISIARFEESPLGIYLEVINYMGQQIINFNDQFFISSPLQMGNLNFPVFTNFFRNLGFDLPILLDKNELYSYFLASDIKPWTFSTFIGSFMRDFGKAGTLVIIIFLSFIIYRLSKRSIRYNSFPISNYILFILLYQSVYFGVFYFRLYSANFYILAMIIIYIVLKIKYKNKKSDMITKHDY